MAETMTDPDGRPEAVEIGSRIRVTREPSERLREQGHVTITHTGRVQKTQHEGGALAGVYFGQVHVSGFGDRDWSGWLGTRDLAANFRRITVEVLGPE